MILSFRVIREGIDQFCKNQNIRRLQAYVECDFPQAIRMVQHLGFEKESIMKNFMGNNDAFMYVRTL